MPIAVGVAGVAAVGVSCVLRRVGAGAESEPTAVQVREGDYLQQAPLPVAPSELPFAGS